MRNNIDQVSHLIMMIFENLVIEYVGRCPKNLSKTQLQAILSNNGE